MKFIFLFSFLYSQFAFSEALLKLDVNTLRPTQPSIGMKSVLFKAENLNQLSKEKRQSYLQKNPADVVLGPQGIYYIIDGHHLCSSVLKSGHRYVFANVVTDWSELSETEFWSRMQAKSYVYLYNSKGKRISIEELPKHLNDLTDDPFRSLAYFARKAGAFDKSQIPFAEFQWAAFYAQYLSLDDLKDHWKKSIQRAVQISESSEAAKLPGFHNQCALIF